MSRANSVHPSEQGTPITSQPGSKSGSEAGSNKSSTVDVQNEEVLLPTPRTFPTPKDCPPGLGCLVGAEYVFMKRSFHSIEGMGIEGYNESTVKYEVLTVFGQRIFIVVEKKGAFMSKIFCAGGVPFSLLVFSKTAGDNQFKKEVLQVDGHPGSFGRGGYLDIKFGNKKLGRVEQVTDFSKMCYTIQNAEGKEVMKIIGPRAGACCSMASMANLLVHEFDIFLSTDSNNHVGRIAKHWSGVPNNKNVFTRSDIWGVKFPQEYDVKLKASLMSTIFLMVYQTPLTPPPPP